MDGDTAAVRTVLAAGADVQCNDSDGYGRGRSGQLVRESFDGAARGEVRTFDYCWHGRGAAVCLFCRYTPLHWASWNGHTETDAEGAGHGGRGRVWRGQQGVRWRRCFS